MIRALGLMSGTSLDGIDAAIVETDGEGMVRAGASLSVPYKPEERLLLSTALEAAKTWEPDQPMPEEVAEAERHLTLANAVAVRTLLAQAELKPADISVVGFHGQTVLHQPERRRTVQIGLGDVLARLTGIDVVNDFRSADVAAGGQGAPLVPLYHQALARSAGVQEPIAIINIGGVGNITYVGTDGSLIAFDTGPGNALIDDWAMAHTGEPLDRDGTLALAGEVDMDILERLMNHAFFDARPPKSLDRFSFSPDAVAELSPADGAATLTAFTVETIARGLAHVPGVPSRFIVCGGGRHNPVLMAMLSKRLQGGVLPAEDLGWKGDDVEAEAFAYLAVRALRGLPLSLPATTGVPEPMPGGKLHRAGKEN
ncbi:anhydro-N-acetylmuramic acid kinase [Parvibaculum sp.]|jgi:anhydro-N-acetylmuramic acid kinase|uniref:anhydro-N-acetylmuramic acid kinase n=1 Tax=Parvibaculum sp. TaxID=2024848 RepID=UPI000C373474|nr:anhydro-N-acetylmuramic acid kinase [Parvibaculum sp.]MAM96132.1 anhydro-N-acetylmuramic acid kinase [Parvibaculum sp.]HCX66708.1 anhydro-N-acetylmuramic acid kinase [Rhodobiaceae bacterium]|tara:strand:- start:19609 stop:20718 length:1110 start_codon:yes stop_codon:yes gene_type:complete